MEDFYQVPEEKLATTARNVRRLMQERGWPEAQAVRTDAGWMVWARRPDGKEVRFRSAEPETTSCYAHDLAEKKFLTYEVLTGMGVAHPETVRNPSEEELRGMLAEYAQLVAKPADSAHGNGVTTGLSDYDATVLALERARAVSPTGEALLQQQLTDDAPEVRVICIDYEFVVAFERIPAAVTGDGEHNLLELVDLENKNLRTAAYQSRLAYIPREAAVAYLGERANYVPAEGEQVRVVAMCNIGQGGTVRDVSAEWTAEQRAEAERVAREFRLPVIGVDYLGQAVLEVNSCPSLYYNADGAAATVAVEKYVEYLERL